jgi:hypothetical protein
MVKTLPASSEGLFERHGHLMLFTMTAGAQKIAFFGFFSQARKTNTPAHSAYRKQFVRRISVVKMKSCYRLAVLAPDAFPAVLFYKFFLVPATLV